MKFEWYARGRTVGRVDGGWVPYLVTFMCGGTGEAVTVIPEGARVTSYDEALKAANRAQWSMARQRFVVSYDS